MSGFITLTPAPQDPAWKTLAEFSLPGQPDRDHLAQEQTVAAVQGLNLSRTALERLKRAIAEAILTAIEHNHRYCPDLPIFIRILVLEQAPSGSEFSREDEPAFNLQPPDLIAKTSERPVRRGWGFFLIHKLGEEAPYPGETLYTLELFLYQEDN